MPTPGLEPGSRAYVASALTTRPSRQRKRRGPEASYAQDRCHPQRPRAPIWPTVCFYAVIRHFRKLGARDSQTPGANFKDRLFLCVVTSIHTSHPQRHRAPICENACLHVRCRNFGKLGARDYTIPGANFKRGWAPICQTRVKHSGKPTKRCQAPET